MELKQHLHYTAYKRNIRTMEKITDSKQAQDIFMDICLEGFWNDLNLFYAMNIAIERYGIDPDVLFGLRILKPYKNKKMTTRTYLARFFNPVCVAMLDKKPIENAKKIWRKTKALETKTIFNRYSERAAEAQMQSAKMIYDAYPTWLAKHDWKTVK